VTAATTARNIGFDRSISFALAFAILVQTASAFMWAGSAMERIDQLEHQVDGAGIANERLARLEAQTTAMRAQLDRIEARLDQR
jgi:hypothetical protein